MTEDSGLHFGDALKLETILSITVDRGEESLTNFSSADFDYVDILLGEGVLEQDGIHRPVQAGSGTVVEHGQFYKILASKHQSLVVQIYRFYGDHLLVRRE